MDPKRTAVVLIEYQNDFTSEGGTLHDAVKPVMNSTNMLANTLETVKKARELGATIVHAPITFTDDYHELNPEPYGILKGVVDSKSFRKGSWGSEIVEELKPQPQDIVFQKRRPDGFVGTDFDLMLRSNGIKTIIIGGVATEGGIEGTARSARNLGYDVVILKDGVGSRNKELHDMALKLMEQTFFEVTTASEIASIWGQK